MAMFIGPTKINYLRSLPPSPYKVATAPILKAVQCVPLQQQQEQGEASGIMCEPCEGKGWLLCDFCEGQKTNVKAENNKRIYRRCPSCRAVGYVLCTKCKVFKCVTFPDYNDGDTLSL